MEKVLHAVGARSDVLRIAPVILELARRGVKSEVLDTGESGSLGHSLLAAFGLEAGIRLPDKSALDGTQLYATILRESDEVLRRKRPSVVVVHGHKGTAAAVARAARALEIPVVHLDAGAADEGKTRDWVSREVALSVTAHCVKSASDALRLLDEGIHSKSIAETGSPLKESIEILRTRDDRGSASRASLLDAHEAPYAAVCLNPERTHDAARADIYITVRELLDERKDVRVVVCGESDSACRDVFAALETAGRAELHDAIAPREFCDFIAHARFVVSDSPTIREMCEVLGTAFVAPAPVNRGESLESASGREGQTASFADNLRSAAAGRGGLDPATRDIRLGMPCIGAASSKVADCILEHV